MTQLCGERLWRIVWRKQTQTLHCAAERRGIGAHLTISGCMILEKYQFALPKNPLDGAAIALKILIETNTNALRKGFNAFVYVLFWFLRIPIEYKNQIYNR